MQAGVAAPASIDGVTPIATGPPIALTSFGKRGDPVLEQLRHGQPEEVGDLVDVLELNASVARHDLADPRGFMPGPHRQRLGVRTTRREEGSDVLYQQVAGFECPLLTHEAKLCHGAGIQLGNFLVIVP